MTPDPREEELRIRLRTAAEEHRPDRVAMLARIERRRRGADGGAHRFGAAVLSPAGALGSGGRLRPMAAAAALAAVLVVSVGGTWLVADPGDRGPASDAASAPASQIAPPAPPAASATGTSAASASPSASSAAAPSAASPEPTAPRSRPRRTNDAIPEGSTPVRSWLWSDGEIDPHSISSWSQSNVTLKNTAEITALDVTIRVALTDGVRVTGSWSSIPDDKMDKDVQEQSGWVYYRFRLKAGATLAPGSYQFAAQFNHATNGRDPGRDAYLASASADGDDVEVHGTF